MLSFKINNNVIIKEKNSLIYPFSNRHNINLLNNNMFREYSKINSVNKCVQVNNFGKTFINNSLNNFSFLTNEKIKKNLPKINSYSKEDNYLNVAKRNNNNKSYNINIYDINIKKNNSKPKKNKLLIIGKYSKFDLKILYKQYKLKLENKKIIKNKANNLSDILNIKIHSSIQNEYLRFKLGLLQNKKLNPFKSIKKSNSLIQSLEISNLYYSKKLNNNKTLPSQKQKTIENINKKILNI